MKKLLLILLSVNFVLAINPPEENIVKLGKGWYEITAFEDIVNITPEEARNKAVNRAYNRAVETHTGVEINSRVRLFSSEINDEIGIESFGEIINSLASSRAFFIQI